MSCMKPYENKVPDIHNKKHIAEMKKTIINKAKYVNVLQRRLYFPFSRDQVKKNALFIHISKTAGTSLINAFGKHKGGRNLPVEDVEILRTRYKTDFESLGY